MEMIEFETGLDEYRNQWLEIRRREYSNTTDYNAVFGLAVEDHVVNHMVKYHKARRMDELNDMGVDEGDYEIDNIAYDIKTVTHLIGMDDPRRQFAVTIKHSTLKRLPGLMITPVAAAVEMHGRKCKFTVCIYPPVGIRKAVKYASIGMSGSSKYFIFNLPKPRGLLSLVYKKN
jgi:hypothetical protein